MNIIKEKLDYLTTVAGYDVFDVRHAVERFIGTPTEKPRFSDELAGSPVFDKYNHDKVRILKEYFIPMAVNRIVKQWKAQKKLYLCFFPKWNLRIPFELLFSTIKNKDVLFCPTVLRINEELWNAYKPDIQLFFNEAIVGDNTTNIVNLIENGCDYNSFYNDKALEKILCEYTKNNKKIIVRENNEIDNYKHTFENGYHNKNYIEVII